MECIHFWELSKGHVIMENQTQNNDFQCTRCHYPLVSKAVQDYSKRWFGKVLCRTCQSVARGEKALKEIHDENCEFINLDNGMGACITHQIKSEHDCKASIDHGCTPDCPNTRDDFEEVRN